MSILPASRPQIKRAEAELLFDEVARTLHDGEEAVACRVRALDLRGYYLDSMGKKGKNDRSLYDDGIIVMSPTIYASFNANSDPSVYKNGVAVIKAPQIIWYKRGMHWGKIPHKAFRQNRPITVIRDGKGEDRGMFGCNWHRGGSSGTSSLGCQTIPPSQWESCRSLVYGELDRYDQIEIPLLLMTEEMRRDLMGTKA